MRIRVQNIAFIPFPVRDIKIVIAFIRNVIDPETVQLLGGIAGF